MPAAVCVSAVSAAFAFGLLIKVVQIVVLRTDSDLSRAHLAELAEASRKELALLSDCADQDIAAFTEYLNFRRAGKHLDRKSEEKNAAPAPALRTLIEVPLKTARSAVAGLELCCEANQFVHSFLAADLGAAATLFFAAVRAPLLSVDFNLGLVAGHPEFCREVAVEKDELQARALRLSVSLLAQIEAQIRHPAS